MLRLYLVGCVMSSVYGCTGQVASLDTLKYSIIVAMQVVTSEMLRHVWAEIRYWLDICHATQVVYAEIYG